MKIEQMARDAMLAIANKSFRTISRQDKFAASWCRERLAKYKLVETTEGIDDRQYIIDGDKLIIVDPYSGSLAEYKLVLTNLEIASDKVA